MSKKWKELKTSQSTLGSQKIIYQSLNYLISCKGYPEEKNIWDPA